MSPAAPLTSEIVLKMANSPLDDITIEEYENFNPIEEMGAMGYTLDAAQVAQAIRKDGPFKGVGNHIFRRR